jgi:heme-degrading monooxygenase HmoA/uncharacterized protein YciI
MHYLLFYEVGEDYVSKRAEFREAHLTKAWEASEHGELLLGGALANPVDSAVLLFKGDSPGVAENFARNDPYVTSGAVKRWYVREWTTVAGQDAAIPIRPNEVTARATTPDQSPNPVQWRISSQTDSMILRMWRGRSSIEKASEYIRHATRDVFSKLSAIEGHRGAYLLRRAIDGAVEFVVLTLWDSMDAVHRFAGEEAAKAVIEPEARSILSAKGPLPKRRRAFRGSNLLSSPEAD